MNSLINCPLFMEHYMLMKHKKRNTPWEDVKQQCIKQYKRSVFYGRMRMFLAWYVGVYIPLACFGSYHHHRPSFGNTYWVWEPALMTLHGSSHTSVLGDMDLSSPIGLFYLPLRIVDSWFLQWLHHPTLIASDMGGDGHTYEYPEKGLTFDKK